MVVAQSPFICPKTHKIHTQKKKKRYKVSKRDLNTKNRTWLKTLKHSQRSNSLGFINSLCTEKSRWQKRSALLLDINLFHFLSQHARSLTHGRTHTSTYAFWVQINSGKQTLEEKPPSYQVLNSANKSLTFRHIKDDRCESATPREHRGLVCAVLFFPLAAAMDDGRSRKQTHWI